MTKCSRCRHEFPEDGSRTCPKCREYAINHREDKTVRAERERNKRRNSPEKRAEYNAKQRERRRRNKDKILNEGWDDRQIANMQVKAAWAYRIYKESGHTRTTARALYYFALGRKDYPKLKPTGIGEIESLREFKNTDVDYGKLVKAINDAKLLGMIDFDNLPDDTAYVVEYSPGEDENFTCVYDITPNEDDLTFMKDQLENEDYDEDVTDGTVGQPYKLELWCEKNTMNVILKPICEKYKTTLVTRRGTTSLASAWELCKRASDCDRPTLVLHISDLDAAGIGMTNNLSRDISIINERFYNDELDIRVKRIGLTIDQVAKLIRKPINMPLVSAKASEEANKDQFKLYVHGVMEINQKAELDALERYWPGGIATFVEDELKQYYDSGLADVVKKANSGFEQDVVHASLSTAMIDARQTLIDDIDALLGEIENISADEVPEDVDIRLNIKTITPMNPSDDKWLLDTQNGTKPTAMDVDYAGQAES